MGVAALTSTFAHLSAGLGSLNPRLAIAETWGLTGVNGGSAKSCQPHGTRGGSSEQPGSWSLSSWAARMWNVLHLGVLAKEMQGEVLPPLCSPAPLVLSESIFSLPLYSLLFHSNQTSSLDCKNSVRKTLHTLVGTWKDDGARYEPCNLVTLLLQNLLMFWMNCQAQPFKCRSKVKRK